MSAGATIIRRLEALKGIRRPVEKVWEDCFNASYPHRASGFGSTIDADQAQRKKAEILDVVTTDAVRTLASNIMSGLTPANSRWFALDVGQRESQDERRWLDDAAQVLFENIHASNFDAEAFEAIIDAVCAGWFCLYIDENTEKGGLYFEQWPLASVYAAASTQSGIIDTIYREFELTAEQAVATYGNAVSGKVKECAEKKPDEKFTFVLEIKPRKDGKPGAKMAKNLPFSSITVEKNTKQVVRESGYHEFPCAVPRWLRVPGTPYAVGPLSDALPEANMLNELKRMHLASAEMTIAGMWIAEDDGVLNPRTIKVGPRKVIVANSVDSMKPLQPAGSWQLAQEEIRQSQAAIRKILMADQLQPQDGPAMTATEVHVRVNLIRQLLGPVYGRLNAEYLQRVIERCFGLAYRAGVFTPPPQSLAGRDFSIRYISPLARAQKLEDVTAVERFAANLGQLAQISPDVLDLVDFEEMARITGDGLGVPMKVMRSEQDVAELREQRAKQQQQQQQQMMLAQVAQQAAPDMIKQAMGQ